MRHQNGVERQGKLFIALKKDIDLEKVDREEIECTVQIRTG